VKNLLWIIIIIFTFITHVYAANRDINLVVSYKTVYFNNNPRQAIAVNHQIPAPTLHFKKGDRVTIHVYNRLDQETAIHWHGMLVPWQMDGVLGVSQQGIPPGGVFHYQFTLQQSGTYWYHAHAGLQEQQGLYGAFLIDPPQRPDYHYTKDYVVVLSDWSNTNPNQILANLKKTGDYYSPNFPLQPSLSKFIHDYRKASRKERQTLVDDYKMMQQMRMSIYDLSDVAYDAFLLNGQSASHPWTAPVKIGDIVRLRFIGAAGDTIYRVKIPGTTMHMVHVQGNDVSPYPIEDMTIAPGETYDVLVSIKQDKPTIIYAEASDKVGAAYGALITAPHQYVDYSHITPFPDPLPVTREMMANMMSHQPMQMNQKNISNMGSMSKEEMKMMSSPHAVMSDNSQMHDAMKMSMPTEPAIIGDKMSPSISNSFYTSSGTKYENIKAAVETNNPDKPIESVINMELFGYMNRFIWFINGLPEYKAKPILLEPGKRYRIIFTNTSMMHHPMHIHGHWFILRNGHGAYDPLLHTIDIPPGATITVDLDTEASGQWFFHCHLLYHMMTGMSRVFQYSTLIEIIQGEAKPQDIVKQTFYINRPIVRVDAARPIDVSLVKHPMAHPMGIYFANFLDVGADPFNSVQKVTFKGMYGYDYNKLELFTNDAEISKGTIENADVDVFYWHLLDQFWAIKGGVNYFYRPASTPYWQPGIGIEGLMPYFIETNLRGYYYSGSAKLDVELARDTQITNNFFIRASVRSILASKTVSKAAIGSGLNQMRYIIRPYYRLMPGFSVFAEYENERDYGSFKKVLRNEGEPTGQNTLTFGFSVLF
jgi:CopA family copper-resistance protein